MKKILLILSWSIIITSAATAQNKKSYFKLNLTGAGIGLEHFFTPEISWHNEFGGYYWGIVNDQIQNQNTFDDKAVVNPYFLSSVRYYFVPLHQIKKNWEVGWRVSATYTGLYTFDSNYKNNIANSHQLGIFAGTSIHISRKFYVELELGPGYDFGHLYNYHFNFLGNAGIGLIF
jgi:hypothetical protein